MTGGSDDGVVVTLQAAAAEVTPALARHLLVDVLDLWQCDDPDHVAALLTSELVSNVVRHAKTRLTLELQLAHDILRVAVSDASSVEPTLRALPTDAEDGRGLALLATISQAWGVDPDPIGKTVWFELRVERPVGGRPRLVGRPEATQPHDEVLES